VATALVLRLMPRSSSTPSGSAYPWTEDALPGTHRADGRGAPVYEVTETGPDHSKRFEATVVIGGERVGVGLGSSKKQAEIAACARVVVCAAVIQVIHRA